MDVDDRIDRAEAEKITLFHFQFYRDLMNNAAERSLWENCVFLLHWLCHRGGPSLPLITIKRSGEITTQKIVSDTCYFCSLSFLCFHQVYGLASLISICIPLSTVLPLLRSIHLGWCFLLSPITMATAAAGCHWSLYNIPREAKGGGQRESVSGDGRD